MKKAKYDYLVSTSTVIICTLATFVFNIYVKRYVEPYFYGIYTSSNMLLLYLNYLQLGVMNSYNRDYPQLLGAMNYTEANYRKNVVFTYIILVYGIAALLLSLIFSFLILSNNINYYLGLGLLLNSIFAILTALYNFIDNSLKSEKKFIYTSIFQIVKTLSFIVIGLYAVKLYRYEGLLYSTLASLIIVVILNIRLLTKCKFIINFKIVIEMIRYGLPLLINSLIWTIMMSVDKFVILFFMTMDDLGIYSVALLSFSTLMLIPQTVSQIFYIKISQIYGATKNVGILLSYAKKYTLYLAILASLISIGAYYFLPLFIKYAMPNYAEGTMAAQILIYGVGLYSTTLLYSNIFSVLKLNIKLITSTIILCILNFLLSSGLVIIFGKDIIYVAYGTSASYALYAFVLVNVLGRTFKEKIWDLIINSLVPVSISIITTIIISLLIDNIFMASLINLLVICVIIFIIYNKTIRKAFINIRSKS